MASSFFIEGGSLGRRPIQLSSAIAQGAAGTIHSVVGEPGIVVKLYTHLKDLPEYREKIPAMLAAPPHLPAFLYNGRTYVQIAWPTASVTDANGFRGFVMPEVDFQASTELEYMLQKSARRSKQLPEFYGTRVLLAANLAALMAELHALGHYMVDMKPINMRCYPRAGYMAILDTDGFSINGKRRWPARQFSDEYIAPEAQGKKPEQLEHEQDLFALAVIIFRLLNNGIHPYQGIDSGNQPTTLQERVFAGLYAYGVAGHSSVRPAHSSIHSYLEDETRQLFDRAFRAKGSRPSAAKWREHLNGLITNKVLVKCARDPTNHAHFSKGCGLCYLEQRSAGARSGSAQQRHVQKSSSVLSNLPSGGAGSTATTRTPARSEVTLAHIVYGLYVVNFLVGFTGLIGVAIAYFKRRGAAGSWLESHFRWQIRTFWYGVTAAIVTLLLARSLGWVAALAGGIWVISCIFLGWQKLIAREPVVRRHGVVATTTLSCVAAVLAVNYFYTEGQSIGHATSNSGKSRTLSTGSVPRDNEPGEIPLMTDDEPIRVSITELQLQLNALKCDAGPVDGVIGQRTRAAVRNFQRQVSLDDDGLVTPSLMIALTEAQRRGVGCGNASDERRPSQPPTGAYDDGGLSPYVSAIVSQTLETERTNAEVPWSNPGTGERGTITIVRTYYRDSGTPCREYRRTMEHTSGSTTVIRGVGCRVGERRWKLDEE